MDVSVGLWLLPLSYSYADRTRALLACVIDLVQLNLLPLR